MTPKDRRAAHRLFERLRLTAALTLAACASGDEVPVELTGEFAPLNGQCEFDLKAKTMKLTIDGGEQLVITRRKDGVLLVNDETCGGATAALAKSILISENAAAPGDQEVLIDLSAGRFGQGSAKGPGVRLDLGSGNDTLAYRFGDSSDRVSVSAAGVIIDGDRFVDTLITSTGQVSYSFLLGKGNDTFSADAKPPALPFAIGVRVDAGEGNDKLTGGSGDDELNGGPGNDILKGGLGDDLIDGGTGEDLYDESRPADRTNGNDTYRDSGGVKDKIDYSKRTGALTIDIEVEDIGSNDDGEVDLGEADDVGAGIEILIGGSGDDTLGGDDGNNILYGGLGNDVLAGGGGNDTLHGEAGADRFDEGSEPNGADIFKGGAGVDTLDYGGRTRGVVVTLDAKANDGDRLSGERDNPANDVENCTGGEGNDDITGSSLDNVLRGGGGNDRLVGGAGRDRFDEGDAASGADVIIGGLGFDTLDYSARTQSLFISMDGLAANDGESGEGDAIAADIEVCLGGAGDDTIAGGPRADEIYGGLGDDTLRGLGGDDWLIGDDGDDVIEGGAGEDTLDGSEHNFGDSLDCGPGDDIAIAGETLTNCEI
jgi:hypothetical protein